jgi:hypothetical protein
MLHPRNKGKLVNTSLDYILVNAISFGKWHTDKCYTPGFTTTHLQTPRSLDVHRYCNNNIIAPALHMINCSTAHHWFMEQEENVLSQRIPGLFANFRQKSRYPFLFYDIDRKKKSLPIFETITKKNILPNFIISIIYVLFQTIF